MSGSTINFTADTYDPYWIGYNGQPMVPTGIASATLPTLTGTPDYTGGNGAATLIGSGPSADVNSVAPVNYTVTTAPTTGATSVTLTALPAGIAANSGWYVQLNGGTDTPQELITGVSGNTVSWNSAVSGSGYNTTVTIHQWQPLYPYGDAEGYTIGGTYPYNGNLLVTGGTYYDSTCNTANLGWILQTNISATTWNAVNTVSGYTLNPNNYTAAEYSRRYAGALGEVPSIWQPYLGGPMFVANGIGGMSEINCATPAGFSFTTFNPANVSTASGNAVPVKPLLDYFFGGTLDAQYPMQLAFRSPSGPFPQQNGYTGPYYPATLQSAPAANATTATMALPTTVLTATASVVNTNGTTACPAGLYCYLDITSISGNMSDSGIEYAVSGTGMSFDIEPYMNASPGSTLGTGYYYMHTSMTSGVASESVTLTPVGYQQGYYTVTFNDGSGATESRVVALQPVAAGTSTETIPDAYSGSSDPTSFSRLTCASGCTTAISVAPMGDNYVGAYNVGTGTAFIMPNTRSLLFVSINQYGPEGPRADNCQPGASGSRAIPFAPDASYYMRLQISAYDLDSIINASSIYAPSPYAEWTFPGEATFHESNGCLTAPKGFAYFDPTDNKLYIEFHNQAYSSSNGDSIIDIWTVNPPSASTVRAPIYGAAWASNEDVFAAAA